jgi:hypothetical protein
VADPQLSAQKHPSADGSGGEAPLHGCAIFKEQLSGWLAGPLGGSTVAQVGRRPGLATGEGAGRERTLQWRLDGDRGEVRQERAEQHGGEGGPGGRSSTTTDPDDDSGDSSRDHGGAGGQHPICV